MDHGNSRTKEFVIIIPVSILLMIFMCSHINTVIAASPSFSRQVILDKPHDWAYTKFANGKMCDIKKSYFPGKPDLEEANYLSDGKTLNATLWLSSRFQEPVNATQSMNQTVNKNLTLNNNKIVIESKPLPLENTTLKMYTSSIRLNLKKTLPAFSSLDIGGNSISISNNTGRQISYTYKLNNETLTELKLWTLANGRVYTITYTADTKDRYNSYLGLVQSIIKSIKIGEMNKGHTAGKASGYNIYSNEKLNFSLRYPANWTLSNDQEFKGKIILRPEYKDTLVKFASQIVMSMDVDSSYDVLGEDYRVQLEWYPVRQSWAYELQESSHRGEDKILGEGEFSLLDQKKDFIGFFNKEKNFIKFSLNLSKLNFPDQYSLVFFVADSYESRNNNCSITLFDMTDEVHIPPPDFTFLTTPVSVSLRPGENQNMELLIKNNNSKLNSFVVLFTNETKGVNVDFIPNMTSVPRSGLATSLMKIEAEKSAIPRPYTVAINANFTFPTELTNYLTGERFNNTGGGKIFEHSFITITVLPEYTDLERFTNFTNSVISPISGFWTFLAGVGAVIAPLIIYIKRSRKNRRNDDHATDEWEY